jgi:hypothetical protein
MSGPRLMWLLRRGLRHLCLVVIFGAIVVGCTSTSSSSSNAVSRGSASATATGTDTRSNVSTSAKASSRPSRTGCTGLKLASGTGPCRGSSGLSLPVEASAYGSATTVPFKVYDSTLYVLYSYGCLSPGGSGFVADIINGSPHNPGSDDETIANESGTSNLAHTTVYLHDTPGNYFLQVKSPCNWTITVFND